MYFAKYILAVSLRTRTNGLQTCFVSHLQGRGTGCGQSDQQTSKLFTTLMLYLGGKLEPGLLSVTSLSSKSYYQPANGNEGGLKNRETDLNSQKRWRNGDQKTDSTEVPAASLL